jgi:hypothetical protein
MNALAHLVCSQGEVGDLNETAFSGEIDDENGAFSCENVTIYADGIDDALEVTFTLLMRSKTHQNHRKAYDFSHHPPILRCYHSHPLFETFCLSWTNGSDPPQRDLNSSMACDFFDHLQNLGHRNLPHRF